MTKHLRATRKLQAEVLEQRHLLNGDTRYVAGPTEFGFNSEVNIFDQNASTGDPVYFSANSPTKWKVLWRTQGQTAGTEVVLNTDGEPLRNPNNGIYVGDTFYVQSNFVELWRIPSATSKATIVPLPTGVTPRGPMTQFKGILYFPAQSSTLGVELWRTDGVNTRLVKDISPLRGSSNPGNFTVFNNRLFFTAKDPEHGQEWHYTDGTAAGTKLLKDIGESSGINSEVEVLGNQLYFTVNGRLWNSDGTTAGTRQVSTLVDGVNNLTALGDKLYFSASTVLDNNRELWMTDGTSAGTLQVKDIYAGNKGSFPEAITAVNGSLFFVADGGQAKGRELWVSDGTSTGTKLVRDINHSIAGSGVDHLTNVNGKLYFTANTDSGSQLFQSDGTTFGTYEIPGTARYLDNLVDAGDQLYFKIKITGRNYALYVVDTNQAVSPAVLAVTKNANGRIEIFDNTSSGNDEFLLVERNGANLVITETGKRPLQIMNTIPNTVTVQGRRMLIPMAKIEGSSQPLIINLGLGNDKITLDTNGDTGDIFPKTGFSIDLGTGSDLLDIADNTTNNTWSMGSNRTGNFRIGTLGGASFYHLENARGGAGADTFNVAYDSNGKYITLDGESNGADNTLNMQANADLRLNSNQMTIQAATSRQYSFRFDNIQSVSLTGGAGANVLHASAFPGSVTLSGGDGSDMLIGSHFNDVLIGGAGADWLSGNGGNDTMRGDAGRDILFGGGGSDYLQGGDGEDILSGSNAVETGETQIRNLIAAWNSGGTYQQRIQLLNSKMSHDSDNVADTIFGNANLDWFFADSSNPGDEIDVPNVGLRDRITGEKVTNI